LANDAILLLTNSGRFFHQPDRHHRDERRNQREERRTPRRLTITKRRGTQHGVARIAEFQPEIRVLPRPGGFSACVRDRGALLR
jgi:hypothetical protein